MQTYTIPNLINVDTSLFDSNQQKVFEYYKKYTKNGTDFTIVERNEKVRKPIEFLVKKLNEELSKQKSKTRKTVTKSKKTNRKKTTKTKGRDLFKSGENVILTKDYRSLKKGQMLVVSYDERPNAEEISVRTPGIIARGYDITADLIKRTSTRKTTRKTSTRKTTRKTSTRKTTRKTTTAKQVNSVDLQKSIIKSFYLMLDKEVPRSRVLTLYRKIEKSALEKNIRKKDKYSKEIEAISKELAKQWNKNKSYVTISVVDSEKEMLKKIAYSETQRTSVRLLKQFAYLIGKEEVPKVKRLVKAIERAKINKSDPYFDEIQTATKKLEKYLKDKKEIKMSVADLRGLQGLLGYKWKPSKAQRREFARKMNEDQEFADAYNERKKKKAEKKRANSKFDYSSAGGEYVPTKAQNDVAFRALNGDYGNLTDAQENACNMVISAYSLKEKTHHDNIHIVNELKRKGLSGISELGEMYFDNDDLEFVDDLKKKSVESLNIDKKVINSNTLKGVYFETIKFKDDYLELIGEPSNPFYLMIYGSPGSGKSTFTIKFQKYLASQHNFKVLFWAKEEGLSRTTQEKFERLEAFDKNIFIAEELPKDLSNYDFLVIDSVNDAKISDEEVEKIQKDFPNLSLIMVFQTTKDGKFRGENTWEHLVDTVIQVSNGKAITGKNRFGAKGEVDIFDEEL